MRSPFPGMDPYLEATWRDVHQSLCTYARDALQPQLQPSLFARLEERLVVESAWERDRPIYPDVALTESEPWQPAGGSAYAGSAVVEPLVIPEDEPLTEGLVQIFEPGQNDRLVTAIEFLSPSNKRPGDGQRKYLDKQREYREAGVSLVEVDLLRGGQRVLSIGDDIPRTHLTIYQVCVRRAYMGQHEIYAVPLQRALPAIKIPLRDGDPDVTLDLQALFSQAYQNGAYYRRIDYTKPPNPPLNPGDAKWAADLLRTSAPRE